MATIVLNEVCVTVTEVLRHHCALPDFQLDRTTVGTSAIDSYFLIEHVSVRLYCITSNDQEHRRLWTQFLSRWDLLDRTCQTYLTPGTALTEPAVDQRMIIA
jgi:hypothetical protein